MIALPAMIKRVNNPTVARGSILAGGTHRAGIAGPGPDDLYYFPGAGTLAAMTDLRLERKPEMMKVRRSTVEHPFGTIKNWMGHTHFQMKTLERVSTEMSLHVLAYNLKRVINILGAGTLIQAMQA